MTEYLITDTVKEIIYKNKKNILTLFSEYDKTNITIQQLQTELTNLGIKLGDYTSDDTGGVLDHNVSVIRNLAIAVDNSNAISARVKTLEEKNNLIEIKDISNFDYNGNTDKTYEIHFTDTSNNNLDIIYRSKLITISSSNLGIFQYIYKFLEGSKYEWNSKSPTFIIKSDNIYLKVSKMYYYG